MSFTPNIIQQVWNKAKIVDGYNPEIFRKDPCGAWIIRNKYGATDNPYGWVIDHVYPKFLGGDDNLRNGLYLPSRSRRILRLSTSDRSRSSATGCSRTIGDVPETP